MLTYFQEKDLVRISDQQPANWEEAIRISCDNLIEKEIINQIYVDEVVAAWSLHCHCTRRSNATINR